MTTTRELDRLTEGWPDDGDNFDLAVFAGTFRSQRPELAAPALDRVAARLHGELDREALRITPRPSVVALITAPVSRGIRLAGRVDVRRLVPMATAASVLLALGVWAVYRPGQSGEVRPAPGVPARPTPVKERPAPNHIPPEGPQFPIQ